jgi:hypothetical protein
MAAEGGGQGIKIIEHPNREKPESKAMKAAVVLLMIATVADLVIITIAGWKVEESARVFQIPYMIVYLIIAWYVWNWNRGLLPIAAAFAILLLIFAAVASPTWFDRTKDGYADASLPAGLLGTLTVIVIPLQALLIYCAMKAFGQGWNIEVERWETAPGGRPAEAAA